MREPIVVFDTNCVLCSGMVAFILAHERNRALRFVGAWSDNSLRFDFAFVRLCDPNGGTAVEIARGSAWHLVAGFPFGAKDVERVVKLRTIEFRFAADSPLEERRFEPSVPP